MTTVDQTATQPRTLTFYCPGCRSWHEAESLLEAVRAESERIRLENEKEHNDDYNSSD